MRRDFLFWAAVTCAISAGAVQAQALPPEVEAALARAKIPRDAVALLVQTCQAQGATLVIATHDHRVVQALAGVQTLDLNEIGHQRLLDKRYQLSNQE